MRAGEIYALAGVQGNGQTELTEALVGLEHITEGRILLRGKDITHIGINDILELGVGYVPEDRLHDGLVGSFSIAENLVLDTYDAPPYAKGIALQLAAIGANAEQRVGEFDVRTPSPPSASASTLSGGNQQKVVLARELSRPLDLLVVAQPTRGLDVGSIEFVHRRIVAERDRGAAVVLVSTELDEVLGLADRIGVMYRGKIIGEVPGGTSAEEIGLLMAGSTTEHAVDPAAGEMAEVPGPEAVAVNPASRRGSGGGARERPGSGRPAGRHRSAPPRASRPRRRPARRSAGGCSNGVLEGNAVVVTFLALVVALVIGAVLIALADPATRASAHYFTAAPGDTFTVGLHGDRPRLQGGLRGRDLQPGHGGQRHARRASSTRSRRP